MARLERRGSPEADLFGSTPKPEQAAQPLRALAVTVEAVVRTLRRERRPSPRHCTRQ